MMVEFLKTFAYIIKYKKSDANVVTDALSRRHALMNSMQA